MNDLDTWCGPSGIWTQLSFSGIIQRGGSIDVSNVAARRQAEALRSLQRHSELQEVWNPVRLQDGCLVLGRIAGEEPQLAWKDEHATGSAKSMRLGHRQPGCEHTKSLTWFIAVILV